MSDGSHDRPDGPAPKIESAAARVLGPALRTGQSPFEDGLYIVVNAGNKDADFAFGLDLLLDGVHALITRRAGGTP